ncbi:MAG: glycosyltransferase [Lactobacillaceae bacterium]|jgi:poly(glycerol-phosphate) alpha-glucosyltransferase|nr:glycosyltransferase [Lactobacillaceae bacterium]
MYFFVNEGLNAQGSGIEHAQVQRQKLFRKMSVSSKIVTRQWNPNAHRDLLAWELNDAEVVNLFDYYAGTEYADDHILDLEHVDWYGRQPAVVEQASQNDTEIVFGVFEEEQKTRFLGRVHIDPKHDNRVTTVERFESFGNLYELDHYDSRGFISRKQLLDPTGKLNTTIYLDIDGNPYLEEFHRSRKPRQSEIALRARKMQEAITIDAENAMASGKEPHHMTPEEEKQQQDAVQAPVDFSVGFRLHNKRGLVLQLDTFEDVSREFYNDLNNDFFDYDNPNVWILDRTSAVEDAILTLDRPAYTAFHIHNLHASDTRNVMTTEENNNYEFGFNNYNRFNSFISAMPRQSADILARYKFDNTKAITIPVGVVPKDIRDSQKVRMADRKFGSVLMIVRRAPDKRISAVTEALIIAKEMHPEIPFHLDVYGYYDNTGNNKTIKDIVRVYEKHGKAAPTLYDDKGNVTQDISKAQSINDDILTIHDYITDRNELYKVHREHQVYGLASIMEGFNISMMEAMANGIPGGSTNVNYGPNDLIVDGQNGYLTAWAPDGQEDEFVTEMADKFIDLFTNPEKLQQFSDSAYELSSRYYEENVWKDWQVLIEDANSIWPDMVKATKKPSVNGDGEEGSNISELFPISTRKDEITFNGVEGDKYLKGEK